ncbi:unnamed protein product, partial [Mesorhabditis spiculigera]
MCRALVGVGAVRALLDLIRDQLDFGQIDNLKPSRSVLSLPSPSARPPFASQASPSAAARSYCRLQRECTGDSAFPHTSLNSAVNTVNHFINSSYAERDIQLEETHLSLLRSLLNCLWYAGQVCGAAVSPLICDRYGRKAAYMISIFMMTLAGSVQTVAALTSYPEVLAFGRILSAVFSPLSDAALILYLQEISPAALRGTMSSLYSTGYCVIGLIGMIVGHELVLGHSLFLLLAIPALVGIPSILFSVFMPETPKYLWLSKHNQAGALKSLKFFRGNFSNHTNELEEMIRESDEINTSKTDGLGFTSMLFSKTMRAAFGLSISVLCLTLPFYPLFQGSTYFFLQLGVESNVAQLSSSALMVVLTIACILSTVLIDRFPRRALLLTSGFAGVFSLSMFVLCATVREPLGAMCSTYAFIFAYGIGIGPIAWMVPAELVPLSSRSMMFCTCYAVHSVLVVITSFITVPLCDLYGASAFVPIFILPSIVALLYIALYLPETKGRAIHEILAALRNGHKISPTLD